MILESCHFTSAAMFYFHFTAEYFRLDYLIIVSISYESFEENIYYFIFKV